MKFEKNSLSLARALRLAQIPPPRVAFVGAGGKTTALFQLAKELAPCLVTITTHFGAWQVDLANQQFIIRKPEDVNWLEEIAFSGVKYAWRNDPPREYFYKDKAGYKCVNRGDRIY